MEPPFTRGVRSLPEDDVPSDKAAVTPSHDISMLNSKAMSTLVLFVPPAAVAMRASCPGENFVIIGRGPTHISCGTRALKDRGLRVIDGRQPRYGALESLKYDDCESSRVYVSNGANRFLRVVPETYGDVIHPSCLQSKVYSTVLFSFVYKR